MDTTLLSTVNGTKILELGDEPTTMLWDAASFGDKIEAAMLAEGKALAPGVHCSRIGTLLGVTSLTTWIEEEIGKRNWLLLGRRKLRSCRFFGG